MKDFSVRPNLKRPYFLCEVKLRAPWWTLTDIWPKRHVYFVRHLKLCDRAKKELTRKRLLRINRYFVQKAWVEYRRPMQWREKLKIRIFLMGVLNKERVFLIKYEIISSQKEMLLAEAFLLYFPPLTRKRLQTPFADEQLRAEVVQMIDRTGPER